MIPINPEVEKEPRIHEMALEVENKIRNTEDSTTYNVAYEALSQAYLLGNQNAAAYDRYEYKSMSIEGDLHSVVRYVNTHETKFGWRLVTATFTGHRSVVILERSFQSKGEL